MISKLLLFSGLLLLTLNTINAQQEYTLKKYTQKYAATEESLNTVNKQPEWFKDAKLGIYFHWGLYSVPAYNGWYGKWMHTPDSPDWAKGTYEYHLKNYGDPSKFGYHQFMPMFKAEEYDPADWVKLFQSAGVRFAGMVVQHHDGYAMWKSEVNPNNAFETGPHRDLAGDYFSAVKAAGLKSIATFHHALTMRVLNKKTNKVEGFYPYDERYATSTKDPKLKWLYGNVTQEEFIPYWESLVYEVVDNYHPDMIWFDSDSWRIPEQNMLNVFAHHFNATAANGQEGVVFTKEKTRLTNIRVLDQEQGGLKEMPDDYWMTDITIANETWSYEHNQTYKPIDLLVRNMIDVWSKRGIVLLNVSPTASGVINQEQRNRLKSLGQWMETFGEAVYNTRSHTIYGYGNAEHETGTHAEQSATMKYSENDVRFTQSKDGKYLYVFLLGQPKAGTDLSIKHVLDGMSDMKVKSVSQLGSTDKIEWRFDDVLKIKAPKETLANEIATVFKLELAPKEKHFEATLESLRQYETPEWFKDAKFGIWNVWGPYSVGEQGEWYGRNLYIMNHEKAWQIQGPYHRKQWGHPSKFGYKDFIPMWKAERFDPDVLLAKYKRAGAKYYTSIATFHDNYDLFNSKYTRWDAVETGPHKDIVKMFQEATHKAGLRYGATTHLDRSLDWWTVNKGTPDEPYDGINPEYYDLYHPPYDKNNPADAHIREEWADMHNKRIKDLIDNYELDLLYFDGPIMFGKKGYDIVSHFYNNNLQRHNGKENGVMCIKSWPKDEKENVVPFVATMDFEERKAGELRPDYWQTDDHTGCWGYTKGVQYKSTNYVVDKLIDIVSKNGNLLLNVPLKADGTLDKQSDKFLEEMGQWMDANGEAIYSTRPWKIYGEGPVRQDAATHFEISKEEGFNFENLRFTTKGDTLFVFQLDWPRDMTMRIKSLGSSSEVNTKKVKSVTMVGTQQALNFEQAASQLIVDLPKKKHCEHAFAVKILLE